MSKPDLTWHDLHVVNARSLTRRIALKVQGLRDWGLEDMNVQTDTRVAYVTTCLDIAWLAPSLRLNQKP